MVASWVKDMCEEVLGKTKMRIGKTVIHPDGRRVKITSGRYWGEFGVSNFWYWREVLPGGKLADKEEHGYGWC